MISYWTQFDLEEIDSIHGIEDSENEYVDIDLIEKNDDCPRCTGSGCNYCYMTEY